MIRISYERNFLKNVAKLPVYQQDKLAILLPTLQSDPFHPSLHTKRLSQPLIGILSFRITRDYRVTFRFLDEETIQLIDARHRKDIYR
ncbi:MAG TPA: hypothetical protein ENI66_01145 [Candidatus Yonathbacteria bacterium]|nr:hypothetical protein [Candidatus Yonathbacteria bacterium]